MTKVVAFNGSPRKDGNTSILIRHILEELDMDLSIGHVGGEG